MSSIEPLSYRNMTETNRFSNSDGVTKSAEAECDTPKQSDISELVLDETSEYRKHESMSHKRPQFGTRYMKEGDDVFTYNAWDDVEWDEVQLESARKITSHQLESKMSEEQFKEIENEANEFWNKFYDIHNDKFYKDRHWLFTEFPELAFDCLEDETTEESRVIFEVGCGVGNTIFPILQRNTNPRLRTYCCDFSETAITILRENEAHEERCTAFVCDLTDEDWNLPFAPNSVDVILMIYVLSSIRPDKMKSVLRKLFEYLKPNGKILFRDYGRYDLSQLRFKGDRCVSDNFYVRGEGTFVYFFDKDEVVDTFSGCGYAVEQIVCDKRLQVNRRKQLKMYRVWIQGKFVKPSQNIENKES